MRQECVVALLVLAASAADAQTYLGHGEIVGERQVEQDDQFGIREFGFGQSVLRVGDQLIVGATASGFGSPGDVLVYERQAGSWTETQKLPAPEEFAFGFGFALAFGEDRLFVGAPGAYVGETPTAGVVYVYAFDPDIGEWVPDGEVVSPALAGNAYFGQTLAFADGLLIVGAPYADAPTILNGGDIHPTGAHSGRVHLFVPGAAGWEHTQVLEGDEPGGPARFGATLAADDDRLFIGAPGENMDHGAVYRYALDTGVATRVQRLDGDPGDGSLPLSGFGQSLSVAGDRLAVGAVEYFDVIGGPPIVKDVLLYDILPASLEPITTLTDLDGFGWSVVLLDESQLVVGLPFNVERVYHFVEDAGTWTRVQYLMEPVQSTFRSDAFGERLFFTGGELYVGAPSTLHDIGLLPSFGAGGNLYEIPLVPGPLADLAVTAIDGPMEIVGTGTIELTFAVDGDPVVAVNAAFLTLSTGSLRPTSLPGGCFELRATILRCELGAIPAADSVELTLEFDVPATHMFYAPRIDAYAGSEAADSSTSNNRRTHIVTVNDPPEEPPPPRSGGGSLGRLSVLFLLVMLEFRLRQTGASDVQPRPAHRRVRP